MRRIVAFFLVFVTCCLPSIFGAVEMPGKEYLQGLTWLGHASFKLVRGGVTVYFDPWKVKAEPHDADLILIGHPHFDHCDPSSVAKVAKKETTILTVADSAEKLKSSQVPGTIQVVKPGDTAKVKGIKVEVLPAYNTNKNFHPKENQWAGFVVEVEGVRFYHAGDTDFIPEMRGLEVDVALLPVSGIYVMSAEEAAEAAKMMKPKVCVPMHYGDIVGSAADAKRFQELATGLVVEIMEKKEEG